ncbi:hypothetical protein [uncultured Christiangramia sp.]|uniref:hypothetical protein n=1 Tax=Christiangramia sp. 3-2217-3z TaxID=3417564 RepID=UPI00260D7D95|nr:hypothetical protein [uncultured Christiangramia sp.]
MKKILFCLIILVPLLTNAQTWPAAGNVAGFNDELREVRMFDFDESPCYENEFVEGKVINNKENQSICIFVTTYWMRYFISKRI